MGRHHAITLAFIVALSGCTAGRLAGPGSGAYRPPLTARDDQSPAARLLLAKSYFFQGEFERASSLLEESGPRSCRNIDFSKWLARSYAEAGRTDEALGVLSEALRCSSEDPDLLLLAGRCMAETDRLSEAMEYLTKATAFDERIAAAYVELAELYREAGLHHEATAFARRSSCILRRER